MTDGLLIARSELKRAFTQVKSVARPRKGSRAYLFSQDGLLWIQTRNLEIGVPAAGDLMAVVSVDASVLGRASLVLPAEDPIVIQVVDKELHIGSFSLTCQLHDSPPAFLRRSDDQSKIKGSGSPKPADRSVDALSLPKHLTSRFLLSVHARNSEETIALSGLSSAIDNALLERNLKVTQALKILNPYRVTHRDLVDLIAKCVQRDEEQ